MVFANTSDTHRADLLVTIWVYLCTVMTTTNVETNTFSRVIVPTPLEGEGTIYPNRFFFLFVQKILTDRCL